MIDVSNVEHIARKMPFLMRKSVQNRRTQNPSTVCGLTLVFTGAAEGGMRLGERLLESHNYCTPLTTEPTNGLTHKTPEILEPALQRRCSSAGVLAPRGHASFNERRRSAAQTSKRTRGTARFPTTSRNNPANSSARNSMLTRCRSTWCQGARPRRRPRGDPAPRRPRGGPRGWGGCRRRPAQRER